VPTGHDAKAIDDTKSAKKAVAIDFLLMRFSKEKVRTLIKSHESAMFAK
jgi:hypothetical protein